MQPIIAYAQFALAHLSERYVKVVEGLPEEALNWQPTPAETNSIAQIVRHVSFGQRLILTRALGEDYTGPMDARGRGLHNDAATKAELLGLLAAMETERADHLARLDAMDLSDPLGSARNAPITRFIWIAHSVGEAREHIGHAELTKQLWEQRRQTV